MRMIRFRMTGDAVAMERVLNTLELMDGIDRIEDVAEQGGRLGDDSSSLDPVDGLGADFRDVELHARSALAATAARDRLVLVARAAGVAVEFVERF